MKKLITGILATLTVLACATGCDAITEKIPGLSGLFGKDSASDSTVPENEELVAAAGLLESMYGSDKNKETNEDYVVIPAIQGFPITWTSSDTENVKIVVGTDNVKIDINNNAEADIAYVLTATIKDGTDTKVVNFNRKILKAVDKTPEAITEKPVEGKAYKLYVRQENEGKDCYYNGGVGATYYYGASENYADGVDIYVEYVENSDTYFYLTFTDTTNTKVYLGVEEAWNTSSKKWSYNPYTTTSPVCKFEYSEQYDTIITTINVRSVQNEAAEVDPNATESFYFGNYSDIVNHIRASKVSYAGQTGNNVGGLVEMISKSTVPAEDKVAFEKDDLKTKVPTANIGLEMTLPTAGSRYSDVAIEWTVTAGDATENNGVLTATADTTVTLTAEISLGEGNNVSDTFTILLFAEPAADAEITIPMANAIGAKQTSNVSTANKYYVSGVVKSVTNTTYGNIYIEDADGNELYIYGCKDSEGIVQTPATGTTIKVYGSMTSYNGAPQLKDAILVSSTSTPSNPDTGDTTVTTSTIAQVLEGADGTYKVNGTVVATNTKGLVIADATGAINAYIGSAPTVNVGATITLTGDKQIRNKGAQFGSNITYSVIEGTPITVGTPKTLTATDCDAYVSAESVTVEYVSLTGTLSVSGDFYNIIVEGTTQTQGSIKYPANTDELNALNGKIVTIKGYVISLTSSKFVDIMLTSVTEVAMSNDDKIAIEKNKLSIATSITGAAELPLVATGSIYTDVVITWIEDSDDIASISEGKLIITNPTETKTFTLTATLTIGEGENAVTDEKSFTISVAHKDENADSQVLATFEFGANGDASHEDAGNSGLPSTISYTSGDYTLNLTNVSKVYGVQYKEDGTVNKIAARDAKGNSCLKLGTGSAVATLSFTVDSNVDQVIIKIAKYKTNATSITINGTEYTLTKASNDGEYDEITINTTSTKTIALTTGTSGDKRAMINSISFVGIPATTAE